MHSNEFSVKAVKGSLLDGLHLVSIVVLLLLCLGVQLLFVPQALGQVGCSASPSSLDFSASGGGPVTVTFSCAPDYAPGPSGFAVSPPGEGFLVSFQPAGGYACAPNNCIQYNFYSSPNPYCSTQVDTFEYTGDPISFLTVTVDGSCTPPPPPSVPEGIGPTGTSSNPQSCCGDPISTGSGNYYYQNTDLSLFDHIPNLPILFQRSYNSQDNFSGPLGNNWTHNFNVMLMTGSAGATVKWGDGHGEVFTLTNGVYLPAPGVTNALALNSSNNQYTLTRKDGVTYLFSSTGLLMSIANPNGLSLGTVRDANSNLTQVLCTGCTGSASLSLTYGQNNLISSVADSTGRTVSYTYDTNSNLISETDPLGNVTKYAYDSSKRLVSVTLPNGSVQFQNTYDSMNRVVSQANAIGYTITLAYSTPQQGQTTITDPLGHSTIHTYDTSTRIVGIADALGNTTGYAYDANNNLSTITDARGNISNFTYDLLGNMLTSKDALGNTTSITYNSFSEPLTIKTPNSNTTTFTYDAKGNLTTVQDPLGNQSSFSYNGFGQAMSAKDGRNNTTFFSYNSSNLCLIGIVDALGNQKSLTCDAIGRLTSVTDPNQHTSKIAYDLLNRVTSLTDALGNQTSFGYDSVGNLTSMTDANQHSTAYSYDAAKNLIQVTDALGHNTIYSYDKNNNRISFTNANGKATSYFYDAANRFSSIIDPLSFATSYSYDPVGNILAITDAKKQTNRFNYDPLNRLLGITYADGNTVGFSYDPDGNRTNMIDSQGTTTYSYDALDRLVSTENPSAHVVAYAYDQVGNRTKLSYPDGKAVSYTYNADNRLSQVTDWLSGTTTYKYDPASNLIGTLYPNAASLGFAYDAANRLVQVNNSYAGSTNLPLNPITSFSYVLDPVGNRLQVTDGSGVVTLYSYDPVYELTSVNRNGKVTSYAYDAVGNRTTLSAPGTSVKYSYDAADRLLQAGTATFIYDANGNQISSTGSSTASPTLYGYDAANRLVSATVGGTSSSFSYDGDGNRIAQSDGAGIYNYVNDVAVGLPVVLQESGPDGNISYAYGEGLISESSPTFSYFYQYDGLGSVVGVTNATGHLATRYSYDAWGQADKTIPPSKVGTENKFQFAGQALDPSTGLYFMRARYYEPTTGRFLTKDPFLGFAFDPITLHHYLYVGNNPTNFVDPSGQKWWDTLWNWLTGITADLAINGKNADVAGDFISGAVPSVGPGAGVVPGLGPAAGFALNPDNYTNLGNGINTVIRPGNAIPMGACEVCPECCVQNANPAPSPGAGCSRPPAP